MVQPINRSKTFQALVFANTGRNNLAPNPKLKKNRKVDVIQVYNGFIDNVTRTLSKK